MSSSSPTRRFLPNPGSRYQGWQMAVAVVVAYLASSVAGLPEHVWAVMSVLIVLRPSMASTFDAAGDRVRSTLLGAVCGLLGVGLMQFGVSVSVSTLGIVALLAYVSGAAPALRGAAVAALIILSSGDLPGHSALQVAFLRVTQIGIGVGVALAIASLSSRFRAADQITTGCAKLLRGAAVRVAQAGAQTKPAEESSEPAGDAARKAAGRLVELASSAARTSRVFGRKAPTSDEQHDLRIADLTSRVLQDATMLARILLADSRREDEGTWHEAAAAASAAIANAADVIEGKAEADANELGRLADVHAWASRDGRSVTRAAALLAAPLHLLSQDVQRLCHRVRNRRSRSPSPMAAIET
jgi:uncharacterized membrane protein YccC